jgi:hypothetical protein
MGQAYHLNIFPSRRIEPLRELLAAVLAVAAYFGAGHCDLDIAILFDLFF